MTRKSFIVGTWIGVLVLAGVLFLAYQMFLHSMPDAFRVPTPVQTAHAPASTLEFKTESYEQNATGEVNVVWLSTGLTHEFVESAVADSQKNDSIVVIKFTPAGRDLFAKITKENIGKPLGIFVDNQLTSAPTVQATIADGVAIIAHNYTPQEAADVAARLSARSAQ